MGKHFTVFFYVFVSFTFPLIIHATQGAHNSSMYSLYEVHSWPESRCEICHTLQSPETGSASLIATDQSRLCESCHEGTVFILPTSRMMSTVDNMNNHPIKFSPLNFDPEKISHNIVSEGEHFFIAGTTNRVPLFGDTRETAIVECASCHDPHGRSQLPYLHYYDNSEGQLCIACHINIVP